MEDSLKQVDADLLPSMTIPIVCLIPGVLHVVVFLAGALGLVDRVRLFTEGLPFWLAFLALGGSAMSALLCLSCGKRLRKLAWSGMALLAVSVYLLLAQLVVYFEYID